MNERQVRQCHCIVHTSACASHGFVHKLDIFPVDWQQYISTDECTNVHSRIANALRLCMWITRISGHKTDGGQAPGRRVSCVLQHLIENSLEKFPAYISIVFSVDVADDVVVKFVHVKTIFSNGEKILRAPSNERSTGERRWKIWSRRENIGNRSASSPERACGFRSSSFNFSNLSGFATDECLRGFDFKTESQHEISRWIHNSWIGLWKCAPISKFNENYVTHDFSLCRGTDEHSTHRTHTHTHHQRINQPLI